MQLWDFADEKLRTRAVMTYLMTLNMSSSQLIWTQSLPLIQEIALKRTHWIKQYRHQKKKKNKYQFKKKNENKQEYLHDIVW